MKRFLISAGDQIALCDAQPSDQMSVANCASLLIIENGAPPEWVQLIPPGEFKPADSREPWKLVDPQKVIAASQPFLATMNIDYDHGTDMGGSSRAAGWIKQLAAHGPKGEPGIWGLVDWNAQGAQDVSTKAFRYISPVFAFDKNTREVTAILRAALTNNPALRQLKALASVQPGENMDMLKKIAVALGLPETATLDDILNAIGGMKNAGAATAATRCSARTRCAATRGTIASAATVSPMTSRQRSWTSPGASRWC